MNKIALYTVNFGAYDIVKPLIPNMVKGVDCYLVTDVPCTVNGWQNIVMDGVTEPQRYQRKYKLRHQDIPQLLEYDTVVYMDANIEFIRPIQYILQQFKGGVLTFIHPKRDCVYEEGWACIDLRKANRHTLIDQMAFYMKRGIRPKSGMYQTGVIVRDNSEKVHEFNAKWHEELELYSHRDQLSIVPARDAVRINITGMNITFFNQVFKITPHVGRKRPVIHYLTPFDTDKNIGRAYNEEIERIGGDDDWFVIRDGDTMFTTPDWGKHISDAIMRNGDSYGLIGAMTNRIGSGHQCIDGMFDVYDLREHVRTGIEVADKSYGVIEDTDKGVAGFFMAFKKKTWRELKFTEDIKEAKIFDTVFYKKVRAAGLKVGLMKGIYLVHLYRILSDNPRMDTKHLI